MVQEDSKLSIELSMSTFIRLLESGAVTVEECRSCDGDSKRCLHEALLLSLNRRLRSSH